MQIIEIIERSQATAKPLPLTWVFTYKFDKHGFLQKFKARICVRGDLQPFSEKETYAATLAGKSFRMLMALAARWDLQVRQLDAVNAFPNSKLDEEVYVELPDGYKLSGKVGRLLRALYGLRRSPLLWQKLLSSVLQELGLQAGQEEPCVFLNDHLIVFFFVDDICYMFRDGDQSIADQFRDNLASRFKIRNLGELRWFLGIRVVLTMPPPTTKRRARRLCRKYLLLTYSQTNDTFDPQKIADLVHLHKGTCLIGKENHKDGGTHYHAFCDFSKTRLQTSNLSIFDVDTEDGMFHHPNWKAITSTPSKAFDYAGKDKNIVYNDCERPKEHGNQHTGRSNANWAKIMAAETETDFMTQMCELQPRETVTCFANLCKFINYKYKPSQQLSYESPSIDILPTILTDLKTWIDGFHAGCTTRENIEDTASTTERYDTTEQPFLLPSNDQDLDLSFCMDQVDLERPYWQDPLENTPTLLAPSTSKTTTTNANTLSSTTWNVAWEEWLDGKVGWEDNMSLLSPTSTAKNKPSDGVDQQYISPTRDRRRRRLWLCQDSYIEAVAAQFNLIVDEPPTTPIGMTHLVANKDIADHATTHLYQRKSAQFSILQSSPDLI